MVLITVVYGVLTSVFMSEREPPNLFAGCFCLCMYMVLLFGKWGY